VRTASLTLLALIAFAANSVLCRLALLGGTIDAASFTTVRFASGAAMLAAVGVLMPPAVGGPPRWHASSGTWGSALVLFLYAVPFAFAYTRLTAGTGALILFGGVQVTMITAAIRTGERPRPQQWIGLSLAVAGLVYLVLPGVQAPSAAGAALMATAGAAWGVYSLRGRGNANPLAQTAGNFLRVLPFIAAVNLLLVTRVHAGARGLGLAVASGALASGLGYVVWYAALRALTATRAAVVQLAVPVLAAAGGVVFLSETVTPRLAASSVLVLGGIGLALAGRERMAPAGRRNVVHEGR
jgi:drug/metabolite transporter (DMT)-like permease